MSAGGFPEAARGALADVQLRRNLRKATTTIRARRVDVVSEVAGWEELRERGARIKDEALAGLAENLEQLERSVSEAGGTVHWARDAEEANAIVVALMRSTGATEAVKVKSMTTDEINLNEALAAEGVAAVETDLAELIVQLSGDRPSHFLVPAIHRNRVEIRDILEAGLGLEDLSAVPRELTAAARAHLRERFLEARVGISGANFAVAETGTVCVVESEGNGRMCTTLPRTLITVMGIEKVVPRFEDLGTMLTLLPRSSTGERMNPYTSLWTGTSAGDGPEEFHLVLLDNGRTGVLADEVGRAALRCIRCSACLNVCPVYERTGGHAYGALYSGPIGAILSPQLSRLESDETLPWASSLCGACYEVCPVKIDIPSILVHLRSRIVRERGAPPSERLAMRALARVFGSRRLYERAQRLGRAAARPLGREGRLEARLPGPLGRWTRQRDLVEPPQRTFREWWDSRR
jgi:L-lactate dehydrogenase complex protein LldF